MHVKNYDITMSTFYGSDYTNWKKRILIDYSLKCVNIVYIGKNAVSFLSVYRWVYCLGT